MGIFSLFSLTNESTLGGFPFGILLLAEAFQICNGIHILQDDLIDNDNIAAFLLNNAYFAVIFIKGKSYIYIYIYRGSSLN